MGAWRFTNKGNYRMIETIQPVSRFSPGIYEYMSAKIYHADPCGEPSLSSSIANLLLAKTPAHARLAHPRLNPLIKESSNAAMDLGSVAHELVLGKGRGFEVTPFCDYRTKEARAWRCEAIERGVIPIKADDFDTAEQMATMIRARVAETPGAERAFLDGAAETVVIWRDHAGVMYTDGRHPPLPPDDHDTGTLCRAMIDWIDFDRLIIYDLKTTGTGLSDRALQSKIASGLDLQTAFHLRGIEHVKPEVAGRIAWRWVFIEDEAPFESRVVEMDAMSRAFGDRKAALAIKIWHKCLAENRWPGYPREIERLEYPALAESAWLAREMEDEYRARRGQEFDAPPPNIRAVS